MRRNLLTIFGIILLFGSQEAVIAQELVAPPENPTIEDKEYEHLKRQTENFRDFVQQERVELRQQQESVFNTVEWGLGFAVLAFLGLVGFFHYKSREKIEDAVEKQLNENIKNMVDKKTSTLEAQIGKELSYLQKKILVITSHEDKSNFSEKEGAILSQRGFQNIEVVTEIPSEVPDGFGIIIYWYRSTNDDEDQELQKLLKRLIEKKSVVPLLVYTYNKKERLHDSDKNLLGQYLYGVIANMPVTLIEKVFSILNAFPTNK